MATGPEMRIDSSQEINPFMEMGAKVSARLVAASAMLELTGLALQEAIVQELSDNPALEADEVLVCDVCGTPLHGSICCGPRLIV